MSIQTPIIGEHFSWMKLPRVLFPQHKKGGMICWKHATGLDKTHFSMRQRRSSVPCVHDIMALSPGISYPKLPQPVAPTDSLYSLSRQACFFIGALIFRIDRAAD